MIDMKHAERAANLLGATTPNVADVFLRVCEAWNLAESAPSVPEVINRWAPNSPIAPGTTRAAVVAGVVEQLELMRTKCRADQYSDPPQDCDMPFCGCDPLWTEALHAASEAGWLDSREAGKLQLELSNAVKANKEQAAIMAVHAKLILTLKTEVGYWQSHEALARKSYNELLAQIQTMLKPPGTDGNT